MARAQSAKIWSLHYRLIVSVITGVTAEVSALGVDPKELLLLAAVDDHPHPAELAADLCMPKPTVTAMVKRLEADGFLTREIDPADLRRHRLSLTASGRKATARGLAILYGAFGERLSRLGASEQAALHAMLEKMS